MIIDQKDLSTLLLPDHVKAQIPLASKKSLFQTIGQHASVPYCGLSKWQIYDYLLERERLGSTYLSQGVALPHARIPCLLKPIVLVFQLREAIVYDDVEQYLSDICCTVLIPNNQPEVGMGLVKTLMSHFRDEQWLTNIRQAKTDEQLLGHFSAIPADA